MEEHQHFGNCCQASPVLVGAFYITWVAYLSLQVRCIVKAEACVWLIKIESCINLSWTCLASVNPQIMWSSGTGYDNYDLILTAATLVSLQWLWNVGAYVFPRYFIGRHLAMVSSCICSKFTCIRRLWILDSVVNSDVRTCLASKFTKELPMIYNLKLAMAGFLHLDAIAKKNPEPSDEEYDAANCVPPANVILFGWCPGSKLWSRCVSFGPLDYNDDDKDAPDPDEDN